MNGWLRWAFPTPGLMYGKWPVSYTHLENPMALKADFILSLMELIVGGKDGLQPVERTVIDRCVRQMYREHLQDPETRCV